MGCKEIAFPLLASGNNGFDLYLAYEIAMQSFERYMADNKLEKVYLVVYDRDTMEFLRKLNVSVEEFIDEKYILQKATERNLPLEKVMEYGKDIVCAAVSSIVTTSINACLTLSSDSIKYTRLGHYQQRHSRTY